MNRRKQEPLKPTKKHLSLDDRVTIQTLLHAGKSPTAIGNGLHKSASTIIREIKNHTVIIPAVNDCECYTVCTKKNLCRRYGAYICKKECKYCKEKPCAKYCPSYNKAQCLYLQKSPYLCNGCPKEEVCCLEKHLYNAKKAQAEYEQELIDKRVGIDRSDEEIERMNKLVSPMLKAQQSPYAVSVALGNQLSCSTSTLYRYIDKGVFDARNVDLPERVRRKPRKHKRINNKDAYAVISKAKQGHLWEDWQKYYEEHKTPSVQMDCVEGTIEDRAVLLTLHWEQEHMQLYFIIDKQDAKNVVAMLDKIEISLGHKLFTKMFPVILTDNGHEFADVYRIERSCLEPDKKRTKVFYCEPNRSDEKGECERNHRLLRRIIPKGTSLQHLKQADATLITNHVNSYVRASLKGKCPYDLAVDKYDEDFFVLLGLERIPSEKVIMSPSLLKRKKSA